MSLQLELEHSAVRPKYLDEITANAAHSLASLPAAPLGDICL